MLSLYIRISCEIQNFEETFILQAAYDTSIARTTVSMSPREQDNMCTLCALSRNDVWQLFPGVCMYAPCNSTSTIVLFA